jgi:hypothetical protein
MLNGTGDRGEWPPGEWRDFVVAEVVVDDVD